ncbi:hypothetical protein ACLOJK_012579 [Asimina triloba]
MHAAQKVKIPARYVPKLSISERQPPSPIDPSLLLRVCTILYQQQNATDSKLFSHLRKSHFLLTHESFLRVCNAFPFSWKPVYRFFQFSVSEPEFRHTPTTHNKLLDIFGKARNVDLLWKFLQEETFDKRLVTVGTLRVAARWLAARKEMKRCVEMFHLLEDCHCYDAYSVEILNSVVETLCGLKHLVEARYLVSKLRPRVEPDEATYGMLIDGFCEIGDLVEACKIWNRMAEEGLQPDIVACEKIMEAFCKCDRISDAFQMFRCVKMERIQDVDLSLYKLLITWLCSKGKLDEAYTVFAETLKRGVSADNATLGALVYGVVCKGRVREGCKIVEGLREPDISVYHGLIKGLLKLRKAKEATQVFREMAARGCEPTMHTYIMLLQGHLGKRGRKGPHPLVNFESIFVGGLVKVGKSLEATKYLERMMDGGVEVPRFDYNRFLHCFSNEEGGMMFEEVGKRLREVGLVDLADILVRYGENMTTRERRRRAMNGSCEYT